MLEVNLPVLRSRARRLKADAQAFSRKCNVILVTLEEIEDETPAQKLALLAKLTERAIAVDTSYTAAKDAFNATEPIEEE